MQKTANLYGPARLWHRYLPKTLLVMNLSAFFVCISLVSVQAGGFSQSVSLSGKNLSLHKIFAVIEKQTGFVVFSSKDVLAGAKPVSIDARNEPLASFLTHCLENQPLSFSIDDKTIFITRKVAAGSPDRRPASPDVVLPPFLVSGVIRSADGSPIVGASVSIKGSGKVNAAALADDNGRFSVYVNVGDVLVFSSIGFQNYEYKIGSASLSEIVISLKRKVSRLENVEIAVASNGYQDIPKERSTGSFEVITAKQLQHSNSGNLLKRLDGITSSIVFDNTTSPNNSAANTRVANPRTGYGLSSQNYNGGGYTLDNMTIRGKNTLSTNGSGNPLVVIDGVASAYDISLINPDDVVSVTILKDAAAASIWGSRAANGVLVIKTKRGEFNQQKVISFNGNISITQKPDLFYLKQMSTSDFIDAEIYGFKQSNKSLQTPVISNGYSGSLETPVTEILDAIQKGTLPAADGNAQIDALRKNDIRKDQSKYLLRKAVSQNYSLNVSGGSKDLAYTIGGGYQRLLNNTVRSNSDRINLSYNMQYRPVKDFDLSAGVFYNVTHKNGLGPLSISPPFSSVSNYSPFFFPYSRLADEQGNALAVPFYRPLFISALQDAYGNKILDYTYKPLDDINESSLKSMGKDLNLSVTGRYSFVSWLSAQVTYNYNSGSSKTEEYYSAQSIYMRDLINRFTDPVSFVRNIPLGGFYNPGGGNSHNQTVRALLSFSKSWKNKHDLNAIVGAEAYDAKAVLDPAYGYYGYDPVTLKSSSVTYNTYMNVLFDPSGASSAAIPNPPGLSFLGNRQRTVSEFLNAAYVYKKRYTLSGSVRKDGSSAFGDNTNKTGKPFYSLGAAWSIDAEGFYKVAWLPYLKLRSTFGYNGNSNSGPTSYVKISLQNYPNFITSLPYASVDNLSNPLLRPERTAITNIGLDFGFKNNVLSGSLEYYVKSTKDLLSYSTLDPSLGFNGATYNVADLRGSGVDLRLRSVNLKIGQFAWRSLFNLSYNKVKVTKNYIPGSVGASVVVSNNFYYYAGKDLSVLYAYRWGGLNPTTGAARVVTGKGLAEDDYAALYTDLRAMGSSVPVYFGNLSNTFSYGGLSVWVNINYKLHYFQRRPATSLFLNATQMNSYSPQQAAGEEYARRWQNAGDETGTNVPSRDLSRYQSNDNVYQFADINVYKADNIRLQEVNVSYNFRKSTKFIKNPSVYINLPLNLMIWKANHLGLDPDVFDYPAPKTYSLGFSANF